MIGIDIEEIDRFNSWSDKEFLRVMSLKELEYAKSRKNPPEHLCGFYCVREALVKALNKNDIVFNKIETDHEKSGKPYLVEKIVDPTTEEIVYEGKRTEVDTVASETTVNKIKDLMWDTVNTSGMTGTGYRLEGYNLIGKTGTAQIADENGGGYLTGAEDIISSFAGIYPKDDPKVIIYASVKRPGGGKQNVIWKAIKDIVVNISKYYGTDPDTTSEEELTEYSLTSYKNKDVTTSKTELESMGMNVTIIGNGNKVTKQYPSKGDKITSGTRVFLITNDSNLTVPDVTGISSKQAEDLLRILGISVKLEGNGYVTGQSIGAGTTITPNMEITLNLCPKF